MTNPRIKIGIVTHPGALMSAVHGLAEQFHLANRICRQNGMAEVFDVRFCDSTRLPLSEAALQVVILPPFLDDSDYRSPSQTLLGWLREQHENGAILSAVCAGTFVLAATGLLDGRKATTHWALAEELGERFPSVPVDCNQLLINDNDIVTAGGLMSWVDLGLELVAQFTDTRVMRQLGKFLIVDTGAREQRYYRSFKPKLDHGDEVIVRTQHYLQRMFSEPVQVRELAARVHLTERTFQRRFTAATGLKPTLYLQHLRIHKACELIETSSMPFERVAVAVGYEDLSAFRKTFIRITGQTPREFRSRFFRTIKNQPETAQA